jgi:hypothetical protein
VHSNHDPKAPVQIFLSLMAVANQPNHLHFYTPSLPGHRL